MTIEQEQVLSIVDKQSPKFDGKCPVAQFPLFLNPAIKQLLAADTLALEYGGRDGRVLYVARLESR